MLLRPSWIIGLALLLSGGVACKREPPPPPPPPPAKPTPPPAPVAVDPKATAQDIFRVRCSVCHGPTGHGDGPGGVALDPKPRVFTDATWRATVKDEQLRDIIVKGGAAVGKSPGMPPNPDLEHKPDVVGELINLIRGFKG